jgi:hypothetical protein
MFCQHLAGGPLGLPGGDPRPGVQENLAAARANGDAAPEPAAGILSDLAPGKHQPGPFGLHPVGEGDGHPPVIVFHNHPTVARPYPASGCPVRRGRAITGSGIDEQDRPSRRVGGPPAKTQQLLLGSGRR